MEMLKIFIFGMKLINFSNALIYNENMRSFSHAQKGAQCTGNKENILYERQGAPGVITEQWYTGGPCFSGDAIIRYYIDDDTEPAIEGELFLMHGIGFYNQSAAKPWGNKWIGHLATNGGLYNTFRIPYGNYIKVTVMPKGSGAYWFILRGVENFALVVGDLTLPSNARLRLQKIENKIFAPYQFIDLARSKKANGMLFMVTLAGNSSDFNYLEGCFRVCTRDNTDVQYLSSGTEDFFLSAFYYDLGTYHTEQAGLTYIKEPGQMSAYKIFANDPVLFRDSFHLVWRQGEKDDNECYARTGAEKCEFQDDGTVTLVSMRKERRSMHSRPSFAPTTISSYVWFYEW